MHADLRHSLYVDLYREYGNKVRNLAATRLGAWHSAEDVLQEVFLRLYRVLPTLDLDRPMWPWFRTVTTNICIDILRSPRTSAEELVVGLPEAAAPPDGDAVAMASAESERAALVDALNALPPRQRRFLVRRVVDGATSEELAHDEGTSVDAVKSVVKRSRQTFRRVYLDLANERGLLVDDGSESSTDRSIALV